MSELASGPAEVFVRYSARPMAGRPKHQTKEYEEILRTSEARGWTVEKRRKYFKCRCGCPEKHYISVVLTPSSKRTLLNTRKKFERASCWTDERR